MNNEETFCWKTAAKHWSEGKTIQVKDYSAWKDYTNDDHGSVCFYIGHTYRLRPEPVKWAVGAFWDANAKNWIITPCAVNSSSQFKICPHVEKDQPHIFPARFDSDGYLIVPDEFKGLK